MVRKRNILRLSDGKGNDMSWLLKEPGIGFDYMFYLHPEMPSSLAPFGGFGNAAAMLKWLRNRYLLSHSNY